MNRDPDPRTLDVVAFRVGGWRVGVEARLVAGLEAEGAVGMEPARGAAPAAREQAFAPPGRRPLRLKRHGRVVLVDDPVELVSLPVGSIHPLPPLVAARNTLGGLLALALVPGDAGGEIVLLCDPEGLFPPGADLRA